MPTVKTKSGVKHYPYTKTGRAVAKMHKSSVKAAARKSGF